jgi:ribosomal protein S18 acetylase RimI-like enzyme
MNIIFLEQFDEKYSTDIWELLKSANNDFVPPLSARNSTCQKDMKTDQSEADEPLLYFDMLKSQSFILAIENNRAVGFISFISDKQIEQDLKGNYITTIIVDSDFRNHGITRKMYSKLFEISYNKNIITRTWSTNYTHIHLLETLNFKLIKEIENDRGNGISTVYYCKNSINDLA